MAPGERRGCEAGAVRPPLAVGGSGVVYVPASKPVKPCARPCALCQLRGRQKAAPAGTGIRNS